MLNCDPPPGRSTASSVIPLPIALFSEGLIFELYEGGQPRRTFSIRWEWLVPPERNESDADPQSPQPFQRKRQD
jgi:hypothetical protein